jgi:hypothetical protein
MNRFCYRPLGKYNYILADELIFQLDKSFENQPKEHPYISISADGLMTIRRHYAWDGASKIPDTPKNLRASLIHDALYQLMRQGYMDPKKERDWSDRLFQKICIRDGTNTVIAAGYYAGLRLFGWLSTKPEPSNNPDTHCLDNLSLG